MKGAAVHWNMYVLLFPGLVLMMAGYGLGLGMIISSLTTKYRDLRFLVTFGITLLMYGSSIIIPLSEVSPKYAPYIKANPLTAIIETFKYGFLNSGTFSWGALAYSFGMMLLFLVAGTIIFNKVERGFMDTV